MEQTTGQRLTGLIDKIVGLPVLVVGDLMLDRYIWGAVERISPEAPVPVVDVRRVEDRLGGAAYVARNLARLGAKVTMAGTVGSDREGQVVRELLGAEGIDCAGLMVDTGRPTCVKTRVIAHQQQVVRIDREERSPLGKTEGAALTSYVASHFEDHRLVIVSDYGKGVVHRELMDLLAAAGRRGTLGQGVRPLVVDPHPSNYGLYTWVGIAKPNRREAEVATGQAIRGREGAERAGRDLLKRWGAEAIVLSLGQEGLLMVSAGGGVPIEIPSVARQVFDVVGAGDTVTALIGASVAVGASLRDAGLLANAGAGVVVSEVGTAPLDCVRLRAEVAALV